MRYSKPLVVLINRGTRSGKEALAYSLQRSGRATLIGERTAGAFLAGKIFDLDNRTALYLPVHDAEFLGKRLEGTGVVPDVDVPSIAKGDKDTQYDRATSVLQEMLDSSAGEAKSQSH
jgi:carboxyl-terminal processing protease